MNLYLRALSVAIYQKFDLYYLCLFRLFSGLEIVHSGLSIMPFVTDHLRFMATVDIGDF